MLVNHLFWWWLYNTIKIKKTHSKDVSDTVSKVAPTKAPVAAAPSRIGNNNSVKTSSNNVSNQQVEELSSQLMDMRLNLEGLEKERDFYVVNWEFKYLGGCLLAYLHYQAKAARSTYSFFFLPYFQLSWMNECTTLFHITCIKLMTFGLLQFFFEKLRICMKAGTN